MATSKIQGNPIVIESGTSGIWSYRKWSDGTAECWGTYAPTVKITTISSPWHRGSASAVNFPANLFIETPWIGANVIRDTGWVGIGTSSATSTGTLYVYDIADSNKTQYINIHAIGKWK